MEVNRADGGCWVNLVAPTLEECVQIAQEFQIDLADVRAAPAVDGLIVVANHAEIALLAREQAQRIFPDFIRRSVCGIPSSAGSVYDHTARSDLGERCAADCMCGSNAGSEKFSGKYGQGVQH